MDTSGYKDKYTWFYRSSNKNLRDYSLYGPTAFDGYYQSLMLGDYLRSGYIDRYKGYSWYMDAGACL